MMLTDLADACRTSGLDVVEHAGWRTRGVPGRTFIAARGVICHHTAGSSRGVLPSLAVVRDGRDHPDPKKRLRGPLSQLMLCREGRVHIIAAGYANHAGAPDRPWPGLNGNSDLIGIEAESCGDGIDWTAAQLGAYPRLVGALARHYGFTFDRIIAHREWAPSRKIDPKGIDMDGLRRAARNPITQEDDMTPEQAQQLDAVYNSIRDGGLSNQTANAVWQGTTVRRKGADGKFVEVPALQELADAKSGAAVLTGQIAGLRTAMTSIAAGKSVDLGAVEQAAREGAEAALSDRITNATVLLATNIKES